MFSGPPCVLLSCICLHGLGSNGSKIKVWDCGWYFPSKLLWYPSSVKWLIYKLDQIYRAWLIKWVVKREKIHLAQLCVSDWQQNIGLLSLSKVSILSWLTQLKKMNLVTNVLILGRRRPSTRTTSTRTRTTTPLQRDQILQCRRRCYRKQGLCVYIKLDQYTIQSVFFCYLYLFALGHVCTHSATPLWPQTLSKNN